MKMHFNFKRIGLFIVIALMVLFAAPQVSQSGTMPSYVISANSNGLVGGVLDLHSVGDITMNSQEITINGTLTVMYIPVFGDFLGSNDPASLLNYTVAITSGAQTITKNITQNWEVTNTSGGGGTYALTLFDTDLLTFDFSNGYSLRLSILETALGTYSPSAVSHAVAVNAHIDVTANPSTVPIPAAAWLLGSGLVGLFGIRKKIRS
jgi:hypothetical protein